ncbi:hypothetical protein NVV94_23985 [Pseudomonas sp. LS1212]|uniref:hypothetical protein n=1 Tax=Pseudomonas sp. LS1212 TaxID=2972478 RepID=UPI00215CB274|nr:hypothetical protein [Pseudomonas sp. LS1212]UVJ43569.1 hypothetical protein NVV94_23985 [Pseudomonas sp. LS1212]
MRWLFLLLLVLNAVYYVWHQQEAPLKAKEVASLSLYKGTQQDIHLLSESGRDPQRKERSRAAGQDARECLYLGVPGAEQLGALSQRLVAMNVSVRLQGAKPADSSGFWLRIAPESRGLLGETAMGTLSREFKDLKHKIMQCEGIASVE